MREMVTVVTLSVCQSVCHFSILEKAPFSGLKLTSVYILGFKSFKCSTFLKIEVILEKKQVEPGTSAVTAVMYAGTAQSLNSLAHDLLARGTLYQSCNLRCFFLRWFLPFASGLRTTFLSSK